MYNARMWLVVKPTVGIPLFFGGIATVALLNHAAVLYHSDFFADFIKGGKKKVSLEQSAPAAAVAADATAARVVFSGDVGTAKEATLIMPDGRTARVIIDDTPSRVQSAAVMDTGPAPNR